MGDLKLTGFPAWLLWCFAHIYFLIGFRNRMLVLLNWIWNFATYQRGARLITGIVGSRLGDLKPTPVGSSPSKTSAVGD